MRTLFMFNGPLRCEMELDFIVREYDVFRPSFFPEYWDSVDDNFPRMKTFNPFNEEDEEDEMRVYECLHTQYCRDNKGIYLEAELWYLPHVETFRS